MDPGKNKLEKGKINLIHMTLHAIRLTYLHSNDDSEKEEIKRKATENVKRNRHIISMASLGHHH